MTWTIHWPFSVWVTQKCLIFVGSCFIFADPVKFSVKSFLYLSGFICHPGQKFSSQYNLSHLDLHHTYVSAPLSPWWCLDSWFLSTQSRCWCSFCKSWLQELQGLRYSEQLLKMRPRHSASQIFQQRPAQRWSRISQVDLHATVLSKWERNKPACYTVYLLRSMTVFMRLDCSSLKGGTFTQQKIICTNCVLTNTGQGVLNRI